MNTKTKAISEGAMMLAIIGVVLLIDRQFAGAFELMLYFLSIPVVVYICRYGVKMGITLAISASILGFLFSTFTGWFYTVSALIIGVVYGYGHIKGWKNGTLLTWTMICNVIITFVTVILFAKVFGYNISEEIRLIIDYFPSFVNGLDIAKVAIEIILLSYIAMAFLQSVVTHILCIVILQRLKLTERVLKTIYEVKIPKYFAYLIVLVFIGYFMSGSIEMSELLRQCLLGLYTTMFMIAIVDGCITVMCFVRIANKGKLAIFLCMFACMIPLLNSLIAVIGVFDIHEDIRNKLKEGVLNEISRKD